MSGTGSSAVRRIGRILPREQGAAPLDIVIAIMAFLAALSLGASLIADRAAEGWRAGLAGRITVQIVPPATGDPGPQLARETDSALSVLGATPGIAHASPLSQADTEKLVEPWLGKGALVDDLPLPRMIDAEIVPGAAVDMTALSARLKSAAPDSLLDDHTHWIARLRALSDTLIWSAYAVLALIAVATAATVAFATRAGLEAHHDIVTLLHQMGAQSGFIARAFERHYFVSVLGASLAGASLAAILFVIARGLEFANVEAVPFLPPMALKPMELLWLLAVPIASGLIALATARLSVLAALRNIY
ncbi:MAG: cell division protein FtsX [Rhizomicrobium sp.]